MGIFKGKEKMVAAAHCNNACVVLRGNSSVAKCRDTNSYLHLVLNTNKVKRCFYDSRSTKYDVRSQKKWKT